MVNLPCRSWLQNWFTDWQGCREHLCCTVLSALTSCVALQPGTKAAMSVEFLLSLVRLETVAETRVKCTQRHLGGVWKLAWRCRWAFLGGWAACERDQAQRKRAAGERHSCRTAKKHGCRRRSRRLLAASSITRALVRQRPQGEQNSEKHCFHRWRRAPANGYPRETRRRAAV